MGVLALGVEAAAELVTGVVGSVLIEEGAVEMGGSEAVVLVAEGIACGDICAAIASAG